MPSCAACGRWWSPRSARAGTCPDCGGSIDKGKVATEADERLPWHLKLLAVSFCAYMAWRIYQGIEWLVRRL